MINSPVQEIKDRVNVIDVIKDYVKVQKAGKNYRAICPFHSEKKPSFFISPIRQSWHCFGCSKGGDIFSFIQEIEGIEFVDALKILAKRAGVKLERQDPKIRTMRERTQGLLELATSFFEKQLQASAKGKEAQDYLLKRGINKNSINEWRIGYAPDVWQGLSDFLVSKGYRKDEIEKAGLIIKKNDNNFYDRFRGRIIFPISDLYGQVVGFTGRVFTEKDKEEIAKYLNTPNTLLYDKSRILYGLDKAKLAIRKKDQCILVEGQTDVIMSHQIGIENVIATSGTALTAFQLSILKRYSSNLATAFDMDTAGDSATKRGIDLAQVIGFDIRVIVMPEKKDPADVILDNPENWKTLTSKTKSIFDFYFDTTFARIDPSKPENKKKISEILLPVIKRISNRIEQSYWIQKLSKKLSVREEIIEEELNKVKNKEEILGLEKKEIEKQEPKSREQILEEEILGLILQDKKHLEFINENNIYLFSKKGQQIIKILEKKSSEDIAKEVPELKDFISYLCFKSELERTEHSDKEIKFCLRELEVINIKKKLNEISEDITKAEDRKEPDKCEELVKDFNELSKKLFKNDETKEQKNIEKDNR